MQAVNNIKKRALLMCVLPF